MHQEAIPVKFNFHVLCALVAEAIWGFHAGLEEIDLSFGKTEGIAGIDVGKRHFELGSRSALEVVAKRFKILAVPGIKELVEDFGSDNRRDEAHPERAGALGRLQFSFVKLCREMADFPLPDGMDENDWAHERVRMFWPVVVDLFQISVQPLEDVLDREQIREKKKAFRAAFPEFEGGSYSAYTISGLAFEMFARGASEDEVRAFAEPWLERWQRFQTLDARRRIEADRGVGVETFDVNGHIVAVVKSDDETKVKFVFKTDRPDLAVNVRSDGHMAILPRHDAPLENRLKNLFAALDAAEPGRWEMRTSRRSPNPMLINDKSVAPSRIGLIALTLLMHEHLTSLKGEHASGHGSGSTKPVGSRERYARYRQGNNRRW